MRINDVRLIRPAVYESVTNVFTEVKEYKTIFDTVFILPNTKRNKVGHYVANSKNTVVRPYHKNTNSIENMSHIFILADSMNIKRDELLLNMRVSIDIEYYTHKYNNITKELLLIKTIYIDELALKQKLMNF